MSSLSLAGYSDPHCDSLGDGPAGSLALVTVASCSGLARASFGVAASVVKTRLRMSEPAGLTPKLSQAVRGVESRSFL
jgi:hypothetical protein